MLEGRTGEYWPEVVTVLTKHCEVCTKMTKGQYFPVWLEQARLVSSLLYGTQAAQALYFSFKRTSGQFNSKDFQCVMTHATQKEQATVLCKSNASEMREFRSLFMRTFQESSRESSSDNSRPLERNFPGTKNDISSNFRYETKFLDDKRRFTNSVPEISR